MNPRARRPASGRVHGDVLAEKSTAEAVVGVASMWNDYRNAGPDVYWKIAKTVGSAAPCDASRRAAPAS